MKKKPIILGNESGISLVLVLVLISILLLVGGLAIRKATMDLKTSGNYLKSTKVFYIAESGIERARAELASLSTNDALAGPDRKTGTNWDADNGTLSFGLHVAFGGGWYNVTLSDNNDGDGNVWHDTDGVIIIRSAGILPDSSRRTIEVTYKVTPEQHTDPAYNYALLVGGNISWSGSGSCNVGTDSIHSNGELSMTGSSNLTGNVSSSVKISKSGSTTITGNASAPQFSENGSGQITGIKTIGPVPQVTIPDIDLTPYYNQASSNGKVTSGNVSWSGSRDTVIPGGVLYVNGNFSVSGSMSVTGCIIATGTINISGSGNFAGVNSMPALVSVNGNISLSGSGNVTGLVYAKNGAITKSGSGLHTGSLMCKGNFTKSGSWSVLNYRNSAPLAPGASPESTPRHEILSWREL
jgi:hypothetical protein